MSMVAQIHTWQSQAYLRRGYSPAPCLPPSSSTHSVAVRLPIRGGLIFSYHGHILTILFLPHVRIFWVSGLSRKRGRKQTCSVSGNAICTVVTTVRMPSVIFFVSFMKQYFEKVIINRVTCSSRFIKNLIHAHLGERFLRFRFFCNVNTDLNNLPAFGNRLKVHV